MDFGEYHSLFPDLIEDDVKFFPHARMTHEKFTVLLDLLKHDISRENSIPGQSMWDLWWAKWHWDRFIPEYFGFRLSISSHRCSITRKNEKLIIFLFIFITGLHNKP
jgi:hypothetical protein